MILSAYLNAGLPATPDDDFRSLIVDTVEQLSVVGARKGGRAMENDLYTGQSGQQ